MERRSFIRITFYAAAGLAAAGLIPSAASADRHRYPRERVRAIAHDLDDRTDRFRALLDRSLDKSPLDGTRREDELNKQAQRLAKQASDIRHELDRREDYWEVKNDVASALDAGRDINRTMRARKFARETEREWDTVRTELNNLAAVYDLPRIR
jgi:hypothetical protein